MMSARRDRVLSASCTCGKVQFEAVGAAIVTAACYCASCQAAGHQFEQSDPSAPVLERDGGTGFVLYRKDRVRCSKGEALLVEHRLTPQSTTRRVLATCCNSAMFLEFTKGHWLSLYRNRFAGGGPPIQVRTMTKYKRRDVEFVDDVPSPATHSASFMWKLLAAWVAMGFRTPAFTYGKVSPSASA
jgi:hypothetical protein